VGQGPAISIAGIGLSFQGPRGGSGAVPRGAFSRRVPLPCQKQFSEKAWCLARGSPQSESSGHTCSNPSKTGVSVQGFVRPEAQNRVRPATISTDSTRIGALRRWRRRKLEGHGQGRLRRASRNPSSRCLASSPRSSARLRHSIAPPETRGRGTQSGAFAAGPPDGAPWRVRHRKLTFMTRRGHEAIDFAA
jgi:hypothetical protein